MTSYRIKHLDIDEDFYIENDVVKVKDNPLDVDDDRSYTIDDIWNRVRKIIQKAKEYDESLHERR